jgi:prepilin-type N-terminal cleavage/methylation domain-containing protein
MGKALRSARGFTFIELMVALALGMMVLAAAVKLFGNGVDATFVVSQRAEMQQDLRATQNMLFKDISLAGAGLPLGTGVALAGGTRPIYGCDQTGTAAGCPPNGGVKYPCSSLTGTCIPTLYGVIPGYQMGIKLPGSPNTTDLITLTYTDSVLLLNCYQMTIVSGTQINFVGPPNPLPTTWTPNCVLPPTLTQPQNLNDPVVGLQQGDLILVQGNIGSNTAYAVGEVTNPVTGAYPNFTVTFNSADVLHMNQPGQSNDLSTLIASPVADNVANRILVNTYYLKNIPDPTGATTGVNILYRQVNGTTAVPVADNMANMQFTYDTYDTSGNLLNQTGDGGESLGVSLNLIRKINIAHLTMHSQEYGARSSLMSTQGFQSFDVVTSISARNLSYQNRY